MRLLTRSVVSTCILATGLIAIHDASAAGWSTGLTIVQVTDADYSGEAVQLVVSQIVDNAAGCTYNDSYITRNANILTGALAELTAALLAGRTVGVLVATTCDVTGRPNVTAVSIQ